MWWGLGEEAGGWLEVGEGGENGDMSNSVNNKKARDVITYNWAIAFLVSYLREIKTYVQRTKMAA